MNTSAILENPDGFRWDLFVQTVCNGLQLSESMVKRSIELFTLKNISVHMLAQMLIERLKNGHKTFDELSLGLGSEDVKEVIESLLRKGIVMKLAESKFSLNNFP